LPEEVRNEKNHYPKCKPLHQGIWENKQQGWSTQNTAAKKTNQIILMNAWAEITFRTLLWFNYTCMWNNDNTYYRQVYMDIWMMTLASLLKKNLLNKKDQSLRWPKQCFARYIAMLNSPCFPHKVLSYQTN
jgi:hypothetical protein